MRENDENEVLSLAHLSAGYQEEPILRDIDLAADRGQVLSVIGPNGSGKSTLIKTIIGQLKKLGGKVAVCGRDVGEYAPEEMARLRSVLLTERVQGGRLTVFDIVSAGRYPHTGRMGRLSNRDREITLRSLRQVSAEEFTDRPFAELSDGQKQRVLIARALCQEPRLLVLDEPTAYLDIRYQLDLMILMRRLAREERMTVLMSLHEIQLAMKFSDRLVLIGEDHRVRTGQPGDIYPEELGRLFGITEEYYDTFFGMW